ncbi:MAG: TatD family hydrolase [Candidatus Krumholzibacteriia bacterium]
MDFVDTHCHLDCDPLGAAPAAVVARAAARGVTRIVVPAYDRASWAAVPPLASLPGVFVALGIHPWVAHTADPGRLRDDLAAAIGAATRCVAVGEIGLDAKLGDEGPGLDVQLAVLRPQQELAVDLDLPAILHCRGAFTDLLAEVDRFGGRLRGVLHAWSRGPELAVRFTAAGLCLGLGGAVTRDKARARRAAQALPLEHFVLETDAPSIGLAGVPPAETEPHHVADIAAALADLRGESIATVAEVTTSHACRLFGLEP